MRLEIELGSKVYAIYGGPHAEEEYRCNYGLELVSRRLLGEGGLPVSSYNECIHGLAFELLVCPTEPEARIKVLSVMILGMHRETDHLTLRQSFLDDLDERAECLLAKAFALIGSIDEKVIDPVLIRAFGFVR